MNLKPTNISSLTPLRGIAALMVAVFHFDSVLANFVNEQHTLFIKKCYLMVDLFFIMSGFIMLHVYGSKFNDNISKNDFIKFIGARFARVYPLHFITLLLFIAIFYGLHQPAGPINNPLAIPTHLLLLHSFGIHKTFTWNAPSWSISAEWWAYMIFPLLAVFLAKFKKKAIIILSMFSIAFYTSILYFLPRDNQFVPSLSVLHDLNVTYDYGYIRGIAGFLVGMITYNIGYKHKFIAKYFNNDIVSALLLLTTILLFHIGANDLIIIASFVSLVLTIAVNQKGVYKLFKSRQLQYLGDISYSIYLTHLLAIFLIALPLISKLGYIYKGPDSLQIPFFTGVWVCLVFLTSVIFLSSISYYLIEKPCRNWLNKRFNK